MSAIKRFFEKKKLDTKFKQAGSGHKLTESSPQQTQPKSNQKPVQRAPVSSGAARAGEAALLRLQQQKSQPSKPTSNTATWKQKPDAPSTAIDYEGMKKELKGTTSPTHSSTNKARSTSTSSATKVAVETVLFTCPICPASLPKPDIYEHLKECLEKELEAEPLMISVTMIHTLNIDKTKVQNCICTIGKYLQNIIDNPTEEKYHKIRKGNKVFSEKVLALNGTHEFLVKGCGFEVKMMPFEEKDGSKTEKEFFVLKPELAANTEQLITTKDMLNEAEPLEIQLDRNIRVFEPSASANRMEVPSSFYSLTSSEVQQEQTSKTEEVDKMSQLRTKAMRENETAAKKKTYRFTVIRIRFPDGVLLQGTFRCTETLETVREFVKENLCLDWLPFTLCDSIGRSFTKETATLASLSLAPASLLSFVIDETMKSEIASSSEGKLQYLKDECLVLMQPIT